MKICDILKSNPKLKVANGGDLNREVSGVYCCDLLSLVMGRAFADCAWVTVMGNANSVAVAVLADMACIVIAENMPLDTAALDKARENGVTVLLSEDAVYPTARSIDGGGVGA
ncbi:hypothetical protein FACS1894133_5580 [Clostridia bacterium]|nr:hypothetical protein FACS1894133_5580 [Clostridia bacterium]